ncbi:hypothetical protein SEA_ZOOMAN_308 [Microbacterium phage Zooman]|nr:hypothetical protein SEA_ZOOMAN_308 [Microbacterium phage Zooman]
MTIFLIGDKDDDWFSDQVRPFLEAGYFETREAAQAWIDSGDYIQGVYDEYVQENQEANELYRQEYEQAKADYTTALEAGLISLIPQYPPTLFQRALESFEDVAEEYNFVVIELERAS